MQESRVRVLVINPRLNQAVGIKTALDSVGGFEVRPFTSPVNALEFSRHAPPDVAILDTQIRVANVSDIAAALRRLNPNLKLLLTNAPDEAIAKLRADGTVALPARARALVPQIRELMEMPDRPPTPVLRPPELNPKQEPIPPPAVMADPTRPDPYERIADEEPPVPTAVEGGTVREAVRALLPKSALDESAYVLELTPPPLMDTDEGQPVVVDHVEPPSSEERQGVRAAPLQDSPPLDEMRGGRPAFDDTDADLDEPSDQDQERRVQAPPDAVVRTPYMASTPSEPEKSPSPLAREAAIPDIKSPSPLEGERDLGGEGEALPPVRIPGQRRPPKRKIEGAPPKVETTSIPPPEKPAGLPAGPLQAAEREQISRALTMTHEQIGTTAAALILTYDGEMVAHSGEMPTQEIEELHEVIGGDWTAEPDRTRIRYITLPTSRQEYMLHTRRTGDGYALTLAFAGDLHVRDIRQQSDEVAATLEGLSVAELKQDGAPGADDDGARLPFTALWMLNEPDDPMTADIAQAVVVELDRSLSDSGWPIYALNVHADFIYLFCEVQPTFLASEILADLKRISAEAACAKRPDWSPDTLWADAYMALMPGREMGADEVQSFLNFTRSRLRE